MIVLCAEALDVARGGGAERAIRATARALARLGVPVGLAAPADRCGSPEEGVGWLPVPVSGGRVARAWSVARIPDEARRRFPGARTVACGKLLGADALWSHSGVHAASRDAAARARGPVVGTLARAARRLRPLERAYDAIERANVARRDLRIVALSERVRRDYQRWHGVTPVHVVRNGVEVAEFALSPEERRAARVRLAALGGDGAPLALFVAHQFALKGLGRAVAAIERTPGGRLLVVGRGRGFAHPRVSFAGEVQGLERLLGGADVLLHPTRYDPCSLVVLEALAAGIPALTTAEDGASEVAGALVNPDDPEELSSILMAPPAPPPARSIEECARELLVAVE